MGTTWQAVTWKSRRWEIKWKELVWDSVHRHTFVLAALNLRVLLPAIYLVSEDFAVSENLTYRSLRGKKCLRGYALELSKKKVGLYDRHAVCMSLH